MYNIRMSRSIIVNVRALAHRLTGVERYTYELTSRLKGRVTTIAPARRLSGGTGHAWEQAVLPRIIGPADILWSPANSGPLSVPNQVITIHDLSPLEHPEWFTPAFAAWYGYLIPRLVKRVRRILTVSEFSKNRIVERLRVPEDRLVIVQPGVDTDKFHPLASAAPGSSLPKRYILFVGSFEPRKNLERLVRAWQILQATPGVAQSGVDLVLAGLPGRSFRSIDTDGWPRGIHTLGYVGDENLPLLYAGAMAFVLPSLYEGFGLPVLEAMACGTPVLVSKNTALAETSAGAALSFDPLNINEIASALCKVIEDGKLRQKLRLKGLQRVQDYSWERAAGQVLEILNGCV
jgi:glycosyltransferase involved in cell wall biosynthesis